MQRSPLRKVFVFVGVVVLFSAMIAGIGLVIATFRGPGLDQESVAFVDEAVPAIVSGWNVQALFDRAAPELLRETDEIKLQRLFTTYRRLGALKEYRGADGDSNISVSSDGLATSALYFARATFEGGPAVIRVQVTKQQGTWQVRAFRVDSDVFTAPVEAPVSPAQTQSSAKREDDKDLVLFGGDSEGFAKWCEANLSSTDVRYQSNSEIWIAMSDTYGPYPTRALAARAASKYLAFDPSVESVKVVLFRSNERVAEAAIDRAPR